MSAIADVRHATSTVTTFATPDRPVVQLSHGARTRSVTVHQVEVIQWHGAQGREVFVSGPFLRADGSEGTWQKHGLPIVPTQIAALVDEACAGVAL